LSNDRYFLTLIDGFRDNFPPLQGNSTLIVPAFDFGSTDCNKYCILSSSAMLIIVNFLKLTPAPKSFNPATMNFFSSIFEDYAKKEPITRIARWALQLEEFDYEIEHRAGSRMKHVDALADIP
ncbi:hypothetical protein TNCV_2497011, partial [Trichonephila clavipes]